MNILDTIDGALADCSASPHAMRWTPNPLRVHMPAAVDVRFSVVADVERFTTALQSCADALARIPVSVIASMDTLCIGLAKPMPPKRRTVRPLCIDGHAYRRRTRRR